MKVVILMLLTAFALSAQITSYPLSGGGGSIYIAGSGIDIVGLTISAAGSIARVQGGTLTNRPTCATSAPTDAALGEMYHQSDGTPTTYVCTATAWVTIMRSTDAVAASQLTVGSTIVAQKFFGTAAPGSVAGNLPGDFYTDTTNHNQYVCNAPSGTAAPACTSVATTGWLLVNGGTGSTSLPIMNNAGTTVGSATAGLQFKNGTGTTWAVTDETGGVISVAPSIDTTSLVTLTGAQTITNKTIDNETAVKAITAPSTPASGYGALYVDSTTKTLKLKDDAGVVSTTVVPDSGSYANFLTGISAAGVITKQQPSCLSLSDHGTGCAGAAMAYPAAGIPVSTGSAWTTAAAYTNIVALWTTCTSGFLKYDGTCETPAGGGTVTSSGSPAQYDLAVFTAGTDITKITPSSQTTYPLFSAGSSANPAFRAIASTDIPTANRTRITECTFDGEGSTIVTDSISYKRIPVAGTIIGWSIIAKGTNPGITIDILKIASGATLPTTSITASATPALTGSDNAAKSATLTGWTTAMAADDMIACKATVPGAATWAHLTLYWTVN